MASAMTGGEIRCERHTIIIDDIRYHRDSKNNLYTDVFTSCVNCSYVKREKYD